MKLLLHAPTPGSLVRARRNAANALRVLPSAEVRIIINAEAVQAAIDRPDPETDHCLVFCENTLARMGRQPSRGWVTVRTAVIAIAEWQQDGWLYVRA